MADNGAGGTQGGAGAIVAAGLRLKLQTSYGQAMAYSRGYAAEETKAAFERAEQLAGAIDDSAQRFKTYLGRWTALVVGGEFAKARDTVEIYRREATEQGRLPDIARASHCLGATCMWQGELSGARAHLEEALRIYVSEADKDGKRGHGLDFKAAGTAKLANVCWQLGELERARELFDKAIARAVETGHSPTIADAHGHKMMAETARGMVAAAQRDADIVTEIAEKTGLAYYLAGGRLSQAWAHARLGDHDAGVAELRQALATSVELGARVHTPLYQGLLAELEGEGAGLAEASARIEEALAQAKQTGEHWADPLLHRIRGDILMKADPANPAPAEQAYLAAIAVAKKQGARSFGLLAALKLAKLYQSTARSVEAHDVLAPALEGFAPTPEMPEIAEALELVAAIKATGEKSRLA